MEEKQRRILWSPIPGRDEEFFRRLESIGDDQVAFNRLIVEAYQKGWIHVFGFTDKDVRDIVAILQEHFKVMVINDGCQGTDGSDGNRDE